MDVKLSTKGALRTCTKINLDKTRPKKKQDIKHMANYHQHVKPVQRSKGRSAVAAAAYRSASKLLDRRTGEIHDYTNKEHVDFESIIGWLDTREALWNAAEAAERRKDATVAREYEVSIPHELLDYQQQLLATQFGFWLHEQYGVAIDLNIHNMRKQNPHAHILTTTRVVADEITLTDKSHREWSGTKRSQNGLPSRRQDLINARKKWAELCNDALLEAGYDDRIDHRSYTDQDILIPPQIHVGVHALAEYQKTGLSERVEKNNAIISQQQKARALSNEADLLKRKINSLKFQQFYLLSQLNNRKVAYYINAFLPTESLHEDLTTQPNNTNEHSILDAWGFPVSDSKATDEAETEWLSSDDVEPTDMEYLFDSIDYFPDNDESH